MHNNVTLPYFHTYVWLHWWLTSLYLSHTISMLHESTTTLSLSLLFYLLWEQYHTLFPPPNLLSNWRIWHVLFSTLNTTSLSNLITIGCWEHNVNISFIPHALCIPWLHSQGLHNEHTLLRNVMNLLSNCRKGFRPPRCQVEYLGPLHTRDREPVTITLQTLSLVGKAKFYQVCFIICWRDQRSEWMQDGCNIYIDSYMASNGWSFLSTWTIADNRLLETKKPGRPWHSECPQPLIYSIMIMCENPHEQNFIEMAFGWGPGQVWLHAILEIPWPHEMSLGRPLNTFFWALTISWSRLLACVQSGPYSEARTNLNYQEKVQRKEKGSWCWRKREYPRVLDGIMPRRIQAYTTTATVLLLLA